MHLSHSARSDPLVSSAPFGFFGQEKNNCNTKLEQAGLAPGFYISCRGDALIIIHQDDTLIQQYVNRCDKDLEILQIHSTSLSSLNVSPLINLRELYAVANKAFSSLEGLELTVLNLCDCRQTPDLSAVGRLPRLTALLIQHCDIIVGSTKKAECCFSCQET